jgi:hypothetical protein
MKDAELKKLELLANLMDTQFRIPGVPLPIGLDGIIGLIPGIGDTLTLGVSLYIINRARPHITTAILGRMIWNVFIDWLIGIVPFFGDIFDVAWKANRKNIRLLRDHLQTRKYASTDNKGTALFI